MSNNVKFHCVTKFNNPATKKKLQQAGRKALTVCAMSLQKRVISNLSKPGTGTWYSGNPARSSSKGQGPAIQTGRLVNSFSAGLNNIKGVKVASGAKLTFGQHASGGAATQYGWILETKPELERAFLLPALKRFTPRAPKIFKFVFDKEVEKIDKAGI